MMPLVGGGYSMYVLICLFPYIFMHRMNANSLLVLLFSLSYISSYILRGESLPTSKFVFYSVFPIIIYNCGRKLGNHLEFGKSIVIVIVSLVFCLSAPAIYFSILDTIKTGQLINISRAVEYTDGVSLSATAYGMMFSLSIAGIGMALVPAVNQFDKRIKILILIIGLLAIFGTIHIVNRTGLALGFISIITVLSIPPFNHKRFLYILFVCAIGTLLFYCYLDDTPFMNEAVQSYLSREENSTYSAVTGGDRFNRWSDALLQILENPLGGYGFIVGDKIKYAHNLWLDAGLRGGIIPFIVLLIIEIKILKYSMLVIRKRILNTFESAYLWVLCIVMLAQAMTEPVIEGVFQFFLIMIFYFGYMSSLSKRFKYRRILKE